MVLLHDDAFLEGFDTFSRIAPAFLVANIESDYVENVNSAIKQMISDIESLNGQNKSIDFLKGDVAEVFLADSFNLNAIVKRSDHRVTAVRSTEWGSADLVSNFGKTFGLKYYKDAKSSVDAQSLSVFDKYSKYSQKHPETSLEEYLSMYNITSDDVYNDLVYKGQVLVIPTDQYEEAVHYLETKIIVEQSNRPDLAKRLKEVLESLRGCVSDGEGINSVTLSEAQSKELARLYAEGLLSVDALKRFGISPKQLIKIEDIVRESFNAGLDAATLAFVVKLAPGLIKCFYELVHNGKVSKDSIKELGADSLTASAESFIRGELSSAITLLCKSGRLGKEYMKVLPSQIAFATVLAMDVFKSTIDTIRGVKSSSDVAADLFKDTFIICVSHFSGALLQSIIKVPILGYMLGSFIGSIIGNTISNEANIMFLSLCVDTGFTLFGIVEQSYELPDEVFEQLGIDIFNIDDFNYDNFKYDEFKYDEFDFEGFKYDEFEIKPLRRGLIAANKVGYI